MATATPTYAEMLEALGSELGGWKPDLTKLTDGSLGIVYCYAVSTYGEENEVTEYIGKEVDRRKAAGGMQ